MTAQRDERHGRAVVAALVVLAAVLRFAGLGEQRFWPDEAVTAALVRMPFADMLATLVDSESTPPLYYALAWGWTQLFGSAEAGLRSLSALAGVATVPAVYAAGSALVSRRAGLVAAGLAAVAPPLVWYAQEARAYALLVLLSALSLAFFGRALHGGRGRALAGWALTSALALATHYFAVFLVLPQAVWLVVRHRSPRALLATGAVGAVGLVLLPLVLHQQAQPNTKWIDNIPVLDRLRTVPELLLAGQAPSLPAAAIVVAALLVAVAVGLLVLRGEERERRRAAVPATLGLAGLLVPLALVPTGLDFVVARNFLPLWPCLALVVAAGLATRRAPRAALLAGGALVAVWLALVVAVPLDRDLQREAITAALSGRDLDAGRQRLAVPIVFRRSEDGSAAAAARCPGGYRFVTGGASWLGRAGRPAPARSEPVEGSAGWRAEGPVPGGGRDTLQVYAICARPR